MSGTGKNFIDRDWFGADDFWYSFSNEYALSVPDKNYWAIQYVHKNSTRNRN